ncbi:6961_t:CDS:10 [Diversispora eburnea]|uniref:6961_t:CDS:1 n=1 Tax=Diversispora eburnea TaxID=1213867 RepID=A0A9N8V7M5_9GLOM|nr:6961_t:CDS:10 [Diversispora eburnea]
MDLNSLFGIKDKIILITGGSRGIGLMIAKGFIANGAKVYISSRKAEVCDQVAKDLSAKGPGKAISIPADLQKLSECKRLIAEIAKREEINNAGATWAAPFESFPDEAFEKAGTKEDPARVINIGSIEGESPGLEIYAYSASKAALHHLTRVMAGNLSNRNITFNTIAPGFFESKMTAQVLKDLKNVFLNNTPLNRFGTEEDVAGTCIYLTSRAGAYTTGATIVVDGGLLLILPELELTLKKFVLSYQHRVILNDSILIEKTKLLTTGLGGAVLANEVFIEKILPLLQNKCINYSSEQIYNIDETVLCANANGLHKLLPLIIGKYANPRYFKTINVVIKHNRQCVLLLLDNCRSHKIEGLVLSHVNILEQVEASQFIQDLKMNVLQAIHFIISSWDEVTALYLPNAIGIEEFLSVPEENIVYEDLEDDKIITELVDIFKKPEENIEDVEELDDSIEPVIIDISVALKSIENVQMFLFQQENSEKYIKLANTIEKFIKVKKINMSRQSSLDEFFPIK